MGFVSKSSGATIYSIGGDTSSDADGRGGIVRTSFKMEIDAQGRAGCWESLPSPEISAAPVGYRATSVGLNGGVLAVFGGSGSSFEPLDHLWVMNIGDETWSEEQRQDVWPQARYKHAAMAIEGGGKMLVTGGRAAGSEILSDAYMWDPAARAWSQVASLPAGVYRHAMCLHEGEVWVHGGIGQEGRHGRLLRASPPGGYEQVEQKGEAPGNRASHVMASAGAGRLVLWGGTCQDANEVYVLSVAELAWSRVASSLAPSRRDAMLGGMIGGSLLVAQGDVICVRAGSGVYTVADVWTFDVAAGTWALQYLPRDERSGTQGIKDICTGSNDGSCTAPIVEGSTDKSQYTEAFYAKDTSSSAARVEHGGWALIACLGLSAVRIWTGR